MILTHFLDAGAYERVKDAATGKMVVDPASFHAVQANPAQFIMLPKILFNSMLRTADIVIFILFLGGSFEIIMKTNAIQAFIGNASMALKGKELWSIPLIVTIFSIGGLSFGMSVEAIAFAPIGILIARQFGFDAVTGTAMILLGCAAGNTAGPMNPFGTGLAQIICHLPLFSGMWLRMIIWVVLVIVTSLYIMRYARLVQKDPSKSVVFAVEDLKTDFSENDIDIPPLKRLHYVILMIIIAGFSILIWGVSAKNWWLPDLAAIFVVMSVLSGLVAGFGPNRMSGYFVQGARGLVSAALIVGLARSILLVLEDAKCIDAVVHAMALWVNTLPSTIQLLGMYIFQLIMSVVIVSSSGMAAVTMPIMAPLADIVGISRQTAVLIFQLPDGFTNVVLPMSAATMGMLGVAKIPFDKWLRFAFPLFVINLFIGFAFVVFAHTIGY
jgi:Predicted membrane protein